MYRAIIVLIVPLFCLSCAAIGSGGGSPRTAVTASARGLEMSPEELRIRVRALIRPAIGIFEESAHRALREASDPQLRRMMLVWKVEATTTLMATLLRSDPLLALADAWGYVLQMQAMGDRPDVQQALGDALPGVTATLEELSNLFRDFARTVPVGVDAEALEASVRAWAREHPIEGELYRRPSMDSAAAELLAEGQGRTALAALGSIEETTRDVMNRLDLYTVYLPRIARWEALIAVEDVARGVEPEAVIDELNRFTRAVDRIATSIESAPEVVAHERELVLDTARMVQADTVRDLAEERAVVLMEVEAIAERLLDRSSRQIGAAVRAELEALVQSADRVREPLIDEIGASVEGVVDHAFYRALQLLLIASVLATVGAALYARVLRR